MIIEEGEGGEAVDQLQLKHGKAILSNRCRDKEKLLQKPYM